MNKDRTFDMNEWKQKKFIKNHKNSLWLHCFRLVSRSDYRHKAIFKYYKVLKANKKTLKIYREKLIENNSKQIETLLKSGWKLGRVKKSPKRFWIINTESGITKMVTKQEWKTIFSNHKYWKKGRKVMEKPIFEVTATNLTKLHQDLKLKDDSFIYAKGCIMVRTKAKTKIDKIKKITGFEGEPVKLEHGWLSFKIQEVLDLSGLIEKYRPLGIELTANKNILYVYGDNASEEVAIKIAEKTGGQYTKRFNPFLNKGYHRINYYGKTGLSLFTEVELKNFELAKKGGESE